MSRPLLVTVLLLVPLALTLPTTIRQERGGAHHVAGVAPPVHWPHDTNVPLLAAMQARIPAGATIAFRGDRPRYVQSGWVRWVAFVLAPRRIVEGGDADWVVVVGRAPHLTGTAWKFGRSWLVKR